MVYNVPAATCFENVRFCFGGVGEQIEDVDAEVVRVLVPRVLGTALERNLVRLRLLAAEVELEKPGAALTIRDEPDWRSLAALVAADGG